MAYQSLYRRYRPQRFSEIRGQEHLVRALGNAVSEGRVGHAYLLSGPRGTGKTSTARVLAKALNCPDLTDGEPCGVCESCRAIEQGTSFDLQELDAASNRGINEMRSLLETIALGTPGRTKVYILDEVHMLTKEASAALLKSLEEPPEHVVFVLATTDPQKVLPTIRSRTQHFELNLLPAAELRALLDGVVADAGLDLSEEQVEYALRKGGGSARDMLSVLDQVASAGAAPSGVEALDELLAGLAESDPGRTLAGVQLAMNSGREPRVVGESMVEHLRDAFLVTLRVEVPHLSEEGLGRARALGERLGARAITRALELLGGALIEMRQAADPRVPLEVALIRITRPEADSSVAALQARVDGLERQLGGASVVTSVDRGTGERGGAPPTPSGDDRSDPPAEVAPGGSAEPVGEAASREAASGPADAAREVLGRKGAGPGSRPALGAHRKPTDRGGAAPEAAADEVPPEGRAVDPPVSEPAEPESRGSESRALEEPAGSLPTRDEVTLAWGDHILGRLSQRTRSRWASGRFLAVDEAAVYGLPNDVTCRRCGEQQAEVEQALEAHFGRPVPVRLVVDDQSAPPPDALDPATVTRREEATEPADDQIGPIDELEDAGDGGGDGVSKLTDAFPGAELVDVEDEAP